MTSSSAVLANPSATENVSQAFSRIIQGLSKDKNASIYQELIEKLQELNAEITAETSTDKEDEKERKIARLLAELRRYLLNLKTQANTQVFEIQAFLTRHWPANALDEEKQPLDPILLESIVDCSQALRFNSGHLILKEAVQTWYQTSSSTQWSEKTILAFRHPVTRAELSEQEIAFLQQQGIRFTDAEKKLKKMDDLDIINKLAQARLVLRVKNNLSLKAEKEKMRQHVIYERAENELNQKQEAYQQALTGSKQSVDSLRAEYFTQDDKSKEIRKDFIASCEVAKTALAEFVDYDCQVKQIERLLDLKIKLNLTATQPLSINARIHQQFESSQVPAENVNEIPAAHQQALQPSHSVQLVQAEEKAVVSVSRLSR